MHGKHFYILDVQSFLGMPENRRTPQNTTKHRRTLQNTEGRCWKDRRTPPKIT